MLSEFQAFETLKFQEPMKDQMEQKKTLSFVITRSGCMAGLLAVIKVRERWRLEIERRQQCELAVDSR